MGVLDDKPSTRRASSREEPAPEKSKPQKIQITTTTATEWHDIIEQLRLGGRAAELIKHCLLESHQNNNISLHIEASSAGLLSDSVQTEIQSCLSEFYGKTIQLKLSVLPSGSADEKSSNKYEDETPAQRSARIVAEAQQQAEKNIAADPFVIELQNRFGAQLVPGSVSPKK